MIVAGGFGIAVSPAFLFLFILNVPYNGYLVCLQVKTNQITDIELWQ